jgi:hypothetical protein
MEWLYRKACEPAENDREMEERHPWRVETAGCW